MVDLLIDDGRRVYGRSILGDMDRYVLLGEAHMESCPVSPFSRPSVVIHFQRSLAAKYTRYISPGLLFPKQKE